MSLPINNPYLTHLNESKKTASKRSRNSSFIPSLHEESTPKKAKSTKKVSNCFIQSTSKDLPMKTTLKQAHNADFGNYYHYYGYRPTKLLLNSIPPKYVQSKTILDVGCNSGYITTELERKYSPKFILGIDKDEHLINKACRILGKAPIHGQNDLRSCFENTLSNSSIEFKVEDIMETPLAENPFLDCIFALSVSKWIHVHHRDDGILSFFKKCSSMIKPNGALIFEPQLWSSYLKPKMKVWF
ncbi:hypothetical protein HMI55_005391 [Coelomomyces lativittatus]|nr:hypothetical protein HMI55_005391 [Coelomomyces lativittatus]